MVARITISIVALLFGFNLQAQQNVLPAGEELSGNGGTASYSVGQIDYAENVGSNGTENQGVQQPYDTTLIILPVASANSGFEVYPNPVESKLTIEISDFQYGYVYTITDLHGRELLKDVLHEKKSNVEVGFLSKATYLLHISRKGGPITTFKIIKNE